MESTNGGTRIGEVKFPVSFSVVIFLVLVALTVGFYFVSNSAKETLVFFAVGVAASGGITATFYAGRMLELSLVQGNNQKREKALEFGKRWNDPQMFHARDMCRKIVEASKESSTKPEKANVDTCIENNHTNVVHILNFLEEMMISLDKDVCDEETIKAQFKGTVVSLWLILFAWVVARRTRLARPKIWERTEFYYSKWNTE